MNEPPIVDHRVRRPDHSCRRKIRYQHEHEAAEAARRQEADFGVQMDHYPCPHCGGWHTGNVPHWLLLDREYGVFA